MYCSDYSSDRNSFCSCRVYIRTVGARRRTTSQLIPIIWEDGANALPRRQARQKLKTCSMAGSRLKQQHEAAGSPRLGPERSSARSSNLSPGESSTLRTQGNTSKIG